MADFFKIFVGLFFLIFINETLSLPFKEKPFKTIPEPKFPTLIPQVHNARLRRAEEEQSSGPGMQEFLATVIKDGIAASSAMDSPTMLIGGFSIMMQPMPNGTEFAGQLMQMAPHYMSLIPGVGKK